MPTQLANPAYQRLISDISSIYEEARLDTVRELNKIIVLAYWRIGQRIVKEEQEDSLRAQYGTGLLTSLCEDLTGKFGNGFSVSNLQYMRRLYTNYPIQHTCVKLEWSHLRLLLTVKDKYQRGLYEKRIIDEGWSARRLAERLKKDRVKKPKGIRKRAQKQPPDKLSVTRAELYTYKIIQPDYIHKKEANVVVDCGFYINAQVPVLEVEEPEAGEIVKSIKTTAGKYIFKPSQAKKAALYTYVALVERVVDADTVWVNVDCGFNIWIRQKLRLRRIDAPEVSTKRGQRAKEFVEAMLASVPFIIIKTYGSDKYDRYLVDLFYSVDLEDPQAVLEEGFFLNQELLDKGLAQIVT